MRRTSRSRSAIACAVVGLSLAGGCAAVFGLDEPTVREGSGGATASGTEAGPASGSTSSSGAPGSGGAGPTSGSGGDASSSSGGSECATEGKCGDDNPCDEESCADDGECVHTPLPDGPLLPDSIDCRSISCSGGEMIDEADDTEDPDDANPPCVTTICAGGAPVNVNADEGTSCGPDPQACDGAGLCIGCNPESDGQCGAETDCALPLCIDPGVCDPGYLDAGTPVTDDVDGDCMARECTGDSVAPGAVIDDTDVPADLPCGTRDCDDGAPTTTTLADATPCNGVLGFCDGTGTDASHCKDCRDNTDDNEPDAGCSADFPYCHEELADGICGNCVNSQQCNNHPDGERCNAGICGCTSQGDCNDSGAGEACLAGGHCGCQNSGDCSGSGKAWGDLCLSGVCGCNSDFDCEGAEDCNLALHRCE